MPCGASGETCWRLRVATYNVMFPVAEPIRFNGQRERCARLPAAIASLDADVLVLQEMISNQYARKLLRELRHLGWKHHTRALAGMFTLVSGGVYILSRFPITREDRLIFDSSACSGADCLAGKGVVYAEIVKGGRKFHVFGTHLQAWSGPEARNARVKQAHSVRDLIRSLELPEDEPVLIAGDLNVEFYTMQGEFQRMCEIMEAVAVVPEGGAATPPFSCDPQTNNLVGGDDISAYKTKDYPQGCFEEYMATGVCVCCPQELVDYVMYSPNHLKPSKASCTVTALKAAAPFQIRVNASTVRSVRDLSDHYPLVADFEFPNNPPRRNGSSCKEKKLFERQQSSGCDDCFPFVACVASIILVAALVAAVLIVSYW